MKIFSTRFGGVYNILVSSIICKEQSKSKSKVDIFRNNKNKICSFEFFIFFIKNFFLMNFFRKKIFLYATYRDCEIGRHVFANVYRNPKVYNSIFYYYKYLFTNIYLAGLIIDHAYKISNKIQIAYIDHAGYLNGLYFKVFSLLKKTVYTNNYPRGIFHIDFRKKKNFHLGSNDCALKIFSNKKIKNINYEKNKIFVEKIIKNPRQVPWMANTKFVEISNIDFKSITHVVYCHSFVDGQLWFGNDGFVNLKEWLIFTIEKLSKPDNIILIKAHPNFFNLSLESISKWDRKIFYEIKKKYDLENIIFLDSPIKNENLLRAISKKTILISHHGTALLEGLFSGFKCVSSISTFWDNNLKLTNTWDSLDKYHKVLNSNFDKLRFPRKSHLAYVSDQLFFNPTAEYGKKFWYKILIKELKKLKELKKNSDLIKLNFKINKNEELKIAKKLSLNIEEISY